MSNDERAIPTELRADAKAVVTRIMDDHEHGRAVQPGRLWEAADLLREIVGRLDEKAA